MTKELDMPVMRISNLQLSAIILICIAITGSIGYKIMDSTVQCKIAKGNSLHRVLTQCGTPASIEQTVTGIGRVRMELDYGDRLVVLEDGEVLQVVE